MSPLQASDPVSTVVRRAPVVLAGDTTLGDAMAALREHRRGAALVADETGRLVGIFTEHDLVITLADHGDDAGWQDRPLREAMTGMPVTIEATASISGALRIMTKRRIRHLPMVDAAGRPVGILSVRDLLTHVAEHHPQLLLNLPPNPTLESGARWGG